MPEPTYEEVYEPPMLDSTGQAIAGAIQGLNPTIPAFISDAFSVERNYSKGDICIYDNKVYEFTSAKSAGAWDSTKVTQTTIGAVCTSLSNSLTQKTSTLTVPQNVYGAVAANRVERSGNIVIVTLYAGISNAIAGAGGLIATLPEGYRPNAEISKTIFGTYNNIAGFYHITIRTNGQIITSIGSASTLSGNITLDSISFTV